MNAKITTALCGLIVSWSLAATPAGAAEAGGQAQVGPSSGDGTGRVVLQRTGPAPSVFGLPFLTGNPPPSAGHAVVVPFGPYVGAEAVVGDGIGWQDNTYGATIFRPIHLDPGTNLLFLETKLWGTEGGDFVMNSGFGYRQYAAGLNRVFGASLWWDVDHEHADPFYRAGVSLESLGKWWDMRANGYVVVGNEDADAGSFLIGDPRFQGNNIIVVRANQIDQAYSGADFEVGGPMPFLGRYGFSSYIGAYALLADEDEDTAGVSVRVEAQITDDATVGMQYSYDDVFGAATYANVAYTFPDGVPTRWFKQRPVREKLAQSTVREHRIPVHQRTEFTTEPLINPGTGGAFFLVFIDPDADSPGSGTFEDPFGSTADFNNAGNNPGIDIILVDEGLPADLNGQFALLDNQRLLSTSVEHFAGGFALPFTPGPLPLLTNTTGGPVITLANNNEVSGFIIDGGQPLGPNVTGIDGTNGGAGVTSFDINRNQFQNNLDSVVITHVGAGTGFFTENTLLGDGTDSNRGFSVTAQGGSTLDLLVADNDAQDYQGDYEDVNGNTVLDPLEDTNGNGVLDTGTAFEITANGAGTVINADILRNTATNNGTGLALNSVAGGTINANLVGNDFSGNIAVNTGARAVATGVGSEITFSLLANTINDNNGNGFAIITRDQAAITATEIAGNFLNNNAGSGLLIDAETGTVDILSLTDNLIARDTDGEEGITVEAVDAQISFNSILRNRIEGGSASATFGLRARIEDTNDVNGDIATLTLNVGDGTDENSNLFNENGSAAIAVELVDHLEVVDPLNPPPVTSAEASVRILNNRIGNTNAGVLANYFGDGIRIRASENSRLLDGSLVSGNLIQGNTGSGVALEAQDYAQIERFDVTSNDIIGNLTNGIEYNRAGSANIGSLDVNVIRDNLIDGNGDGLEIVTGGASFDPTNGVFTYVDEYLITNNLIRNGTLRGVHFRAEADAHMLTTFTDNVIENNAGHGIETTEQVNDPSDDRSISGVWARNAVFDNGGSGVRIAGRTGNFDPTIGPLVIGSANGSTANGNLIDNNGEDGVEVVVSGGVTLGGNVISRNATGGVDFGGDDADGETLPTFHESFLLGNEIVQNGGDGVEITRTFTTGFVGIEITNNNRIADNLGRGIEVLNRGDRLSVLSLTDVTISGNTITGNGEEGIYVVNTADANQSQTGSALTAGGGLTDENSLDLTIRNNIITANGSGSTLDGTGLVMRIGTMDAFQGPGNITDDGGFATVGAVVANDGTLSSAAFTRGGVYAVVTGNVFSGNFGEDVAFESFDSTGAPPTTAGTWNATMFQVTGFTQDPLARLDLVFTGNSGDSADVVRSGASYNNDEPVFKSRDDDKTAPDPDGPFNTGGRARNAQRLASRDAPFNAPVVSPDGGIFLYPGVGESTFRVSNGSNTNGFNLGDDFFFSVILGNAFGEEDFTWSTFP